MTSHKYVLGIRQLACLEATTNRNVSLLSSEGTVKKDNPIHLQEDEDRDGPGSCREERGQILLSVL
jgi:hypothetical protein